MDLSSYSQPSEGTAQQTRPAMDAPMEDVSSDTSLQEAAALYERLAEVPTIVKAEFTGSANETVVLTLNNKDHASMTTSQRVLQIPNKPEAATSGISDSLSTIAGVGVDPAVKLDFAFDRFPRFRVTLREQTVHDKTRRFVEAWRYTTRMYCVEVTDAHGSFATHETFSSSSAILDRDDRRDGTVGEGEDVSILYGADTTSDPSEEDPLRRFRYQAPMGEKFAKDFQPGLFLLRLSRKRPVKLIQLISPVKGRLLAQACFAGYDTIAAAGYDAVSGGRRLGQVYCTNRPSTLQLLKLPSFEAAEHSGRSMQRRHVIKKAEVMQWEFTDMTVISLPGRSARSPRALPSYTSRGKLYEWVLVWLETPSGGPHNFSSAVMKATADLQGTLEIAELLPLAKGQYLGQLAKQPFFEVGGEGYLALGSTHGCTGLVRVHRLDNGEMKNRQSSEGLSETLLAVSATRRQYLTSSSRLGHLPMLHLWEFDEKDDEMKLRKILWAADRGGGAEDVDEHLRTTTARVVKIPHTALARSGELAERLEDTIEAIVVSPREASSGAGPCILYPHGGPHSASTTDWSPGVSALVLLGYTVILPNYHGSTGRSPEFVNSLVGKCGTLDVDDCVATIKWAIEEGVADKDQVYFQGGSHGGFIGCHLAGRDGLKGLGKAIALRNPVTHVGEMWATTDIRDWDMAEFGLPYPFDAPPPFLSPEAFKTLSDASPARLVDKVEAPVLMLLGDSDQRVPPTQGLAYYHALRARIERQTDQDRRREGSRLRAECLWFQGADHALDTVESARGAWLATWKWFEEARRGKEVT